MSPGYLSVLRSRSEPHHFLLEPDLKQFSIRSTAPNGIMIMLRNVTSCIMISFAHLKKSRIVIWKGKRSFLSPKYFFSHSLLKMMRFCNNGSFFFWLCKGLKKNMSYRDASPASVTQN
jgi:hypothetical protein